MDNPRRVRGRQPIGDLRREIEQPFERHGTPAELVAQGPSLDHLRNDERGLAVDRRIKDGDDVGVVEGAGGPRFGDESPDSIGIGPGPLAQDLERHLALEPGIPRPIDFTAATAAERRHDHVGSERRGRSRPVDFHRAGTNDSISRIREVLVPPLRRRQSSGGHYDAGNAVSVDSGGGGIRNVMTTVPSRI